MKYEDIVNNQINEIMNLIDNNVFDIAKQKIIHLIQLFNDPKYTEEIKHIEKEYSTRFEKMEKDTMNIIHDKDKIKNINDVNNIIREAEYLSLMLHKEYFNKIIEYTTKSL